MKSSNVRSKLVRAKYLKGEATLEKIREAALDEITARGYHRTSVCEIVKRANLTRGAFYNYWSSLDDCLADLILAIDEGVKNNPRAIEYYDSLTDPSETIKKVKLSLNLVLEDKFRFILLPTLLLQEKGLPDEGLKELLKDYMGRVKDEWLAVIKQDQENAYIIPGLDPETVAMGIMNLMGGIFHNSELKFREFSQPMENALILFLLASLTEDYREQHRLKSLLPANFSYKQPIVLEGGAAESSAE